MPSRSWRRAPPAEVRASLCPEGGKRKGSPPSPCAGCRETHSSMVGSAHAPTNHHAQQGAVPCHRNACATGRTGPMLRKSGDFQIGRRAPNFTGWAIRPLDGLNAAACNGDRKRGGLMPRAPGRRDGEIGGGLGSPASMRGRRGGCAPPAPMETSLPWERTGRFGEEWETGA